MSGWGQSWIDGLYGGLLGSTTHLARGRTLARQQRFTDLEIEPGLLRARIEAGRDSGDERFVPQLGVDAIDDGQWDQLVAVVVEHPVLAAAVMTGELPHALEAAVGLDVLIPSRSQVTVDCTCPDWTDACPHVAGLAFAFAEVVDNEPWALLALRGRDRSDLLDAVREAQAALGGFDVVATTDLPREPDPGVAAGAAFRREPGALPPVGPIPERPSVSMAWTAHPPSDSGVVMSELRAEVADAAQRAADLLTGRSTGHVAPDMEADLARRAHAASDRTEFAARIGADLVEVERWARAWQHGGLAGFEVMSLRWEPSDAQLAPGVDALVDASGPEVAARVRTAANVVTRGRRQLRLDRDGRWWRFDADDELGWILASGAFLEAADALDS